MITKLILTGKKYQVPLNVTNGWGQAHFTRKIRHNCSTVRVINQWNRLPWEAADFPFLQVFSSGLDAFVENTFNKHEILGPTLTNSVKLSCAY